MPKIKGVSGVLMAKAKAMDDFEQEKKVHCPWCDEWYTLGISENTCPKGHSLGPAADHVDDANDDWRGRKRHRWPPKGNQMRQSILVVGVVLAGCASSTGILPAGPDTFTITERFAPLRGGGDEAQREALTKANAFCAEKGQQFIPNLMNQSGNQTSPYGPNGYTVTFRCLLPTDPAVAAYRGVQQAPNVIIQQRNRWSALLPPNCVDVTPERIGTVVAIIGAPAAGKGTKPGWPMLLARVLGRDGWLGCGDLAGDTTISLDACNFTAISSFGCDHPQLLLGGDLAGDLAGGLGLAGTPSLVLKFRMIESLPAPIWAAIITASAGVIVMILGLVLKKWYFDVQSRLRVVVRASTYKTSSA
jgi:hypothetical protein